MSLFVELSIILGIAALISVAMRLLRQPLMIGHIITGLLVGPYVLGLIRSPETVQTFAELGIAFLLFIVGLSLSPRVIKEVGFVSFVTGLGQIVFTALLGYGISRWLGFSALPSWYIALGLTFSSTIIILKLLSDKHDLESLYGKISVGFLIFQDIVATLILIVVSSVSGGGSLVVGDIIIALAKTVGLAAGLILLARIALPWFHTLLARSQELLFIVSLGWGLSAASLFYVFGLSLEVGALVAGVALAMSSLHHEIGARLRPLRDFFIVLFFVVLGSQMSLASVGDVIVPALVFSAFVLIGNPLVVIILMGIMGYQRRVGFLAGLTVAQISEFSLILITLGVKNGHLSDSVLSLMTLVGIITIALSTYMILYAERIYPFLSRALRIFEKKRARHDAHPSQNHDIILFGCNRIGWDFISLFNEQGSDVLVVDFDPAVIDELKEKGIACRYGDADDIEFLDSLHLDGAKMVISTVPDLEVNELIIERTRMVNTGAIVLVTAHHIQDANDLYDAGAHYVIMPHFLGATHASQMVLAHGFNPEPFAYEKNRHLAYLEEKKKRGYEHPPAEKFR